MNFKIEPYIKKVILSVSLLVVGLILLFIICMYMTSRRTGLEGPRGGPQDAFRHTYTSALVARYSLPVFVKIVTAIMERNPNSEFNRMDIHNNYLGIKLGQTNIDLYSTIISKIKNVKFKTKDHTEIYIMDKSKWQSSDIF